MGNATAQACLLNVTTSEHKPIDSSNYKILFPVDFSSRSVSAARHVSFWRDHFGASLEIVHVVDNGGDQPWYDYSSSSELSRVVARRTADLEYFCQQQFGKNTARAVVDRKSTRLNSSHITRSRMPSSA